MQVRRTMLMLAMCVIAAPALAQQADLSRFVPGKWMSANGRVGVELNSVTNGIVTGMWLDQDGKVYPIGAAWTQGRAASGRFENGVFHMTTPSGNKWEMVLSVDGTTLTGTRYVASSRQSIPMTLTRTK